jgi:hypothetical protein
MNNTQTPTEEKVMIPVRVPKEVYRTMMDMIHRKKEDDLGYSMNQYLTDLIEADLFRKKR